MQQKMRDEKIEMRGDEGGVDRWEKITEREGESWWAKWL
jgi:hypothetical protein